MNELATEKLAPHLVGGERLLWSAQPKQGFLLRSSDVAVVPLSLAWCAGALYSEWLALVAAAHEPSGMMADSIAGHVLRHVLPLVLFPVVLLGLYLLIGRFFMDRAQRQRTCYGVTNERVIIVSGLFSERMQTIALRTPGEVTYIERSGGYGTIILGSERPWGALTSGMNWWPGVGGHLGPALDLIQDAGQVFELIRKAPREPGAK